MATLSTNVWFSADMQARTALSYSGTEIPDDAHPCDTIQRLSEAWRALNHDDKFSVIKEKPSVWSLSTGPK